MAMAMLPPMMCQSLMNLGLLSTAADVSNPMIL